MPRSYKKNKGIAKSDARTLKKLGLLPTGYKINSLTANQKRHVRRLKAKMKSSPDTLDVFKNPDKYLHAKASAKARQAIAGKMPMVKTSKGTIFYGQRQHATKIRFRDREGDILRSYPNRKITSYPMDNAPATLRRAHDFFDKRPKKGRYVTFRVGDRSPFNVVITSWEEFQKYYDRLREAWEARSKRGDKASRQDNPIGELQIVEVTKYAKGR